MSPVNITDLPSKKPEGRNRALPPPHDGRGPSDRVRDDARRALLATQQRLAGRIVELHRVRRAVEDVPSLHRGGVQADSAVAKH